MLHKNLLSLFLLAGAVTCARHSAADQLGRTVEERQELSRIEVVSHHLISSIRARDTSRVRKLLSDEDVLSVIQESSIQNAIQESQSTPELIRASFFGARLDSAVVALDLGSRTRKELCYLPGQQDELTIEYVRRRDAWLVYDILLPVC